MRTELWGLLLLTLGVCLFLALVSFSRADRYSETGIVNLIGPVGVQMADLALRSVGLTSFFFDGVLLFCGFSLLFGRRLRPSAFETSGYVLAVPTGAIFLHLVLGTRRILGHKPGGFFGELGAELGRSLIGPVGTGVLTVSAFVLAITLISETNPSVLVRRLCRGAVQLLRLTAVGVARVATLSWTKIKAFVANRWHRVIAFFERIRAGAPAELVERPEPTVETENEEAALVRRLESIDEIEPEPVIEVTIPKPRQEATKTKTKQSQFQLELEARKDSSGFELPSTSLLAAPKTGQGDIDQDALQRIAKQLEQALQEFKIQGKVTGITPGPVVTMYEVEPAPGVKLSSIANLAADLARVIKAQSVRIVAPIPGKGVVGIEVPNEKREVVYLRELLEEKTFRKSRAKLPLAIGKDIEGRSVVTDLARMPHLLVAGSTGSGKSVAVNAMVMSLLYQASPDEVRMIMVDPKMLELSIYEGIPHLLVPVVTDPGKAALALKWAVDEMERRYHALSDLKVRSIAGYNEEIDRIRADAEKKGEDLNELPKRLPYIVVVIDEFADLMMVASKDVELCVARLAQKARAAGVHLILATQRPSVDVITGLIKANFPTRISFRVFSRVDSRTVLDVQGAESLLGMGDMLFRPPGRGDLVRVHGAYVDEKEIDRVVQCLKEQGQPDYHEEILAGDETNDLDMDMDEADEMYDLAIELVTSTRKASISMVQRKLRVGYNRAARMIEMMEREGIVSSSDGRGGREVLAPPPPPMAPSQPAPV